MRRALLSAALLLGLAPVGLANEPAPAPPTAKRPVIDHYGALAVTDDYQWLENDDDPQVRAWAAAQNQRTRAYLASLPGRDELTQRLTEVMRAPSPSWFNLEWRGKQLFAIEVRPPHQQPFLVFRNAVDAPASGERVIVDPQALDPSGHTAIDWYAPSRDGKRLAVALSKNGSERGDLRIFDVATGKPLPDVIEHAQNGTGGGSAAFNADGSGLYYTRYPRPGDAHAGEDQFWQQIWFHKLGTPAASDTYCLGREFPRIAEVTLTTSDDGRWVSALVSNGDGGDHDLWLREPGGAWKQLARKSDLVREIRFGVGGDASLYLRSLAGAPNGQILRLRLGQPLSAAKLIVAQGGSSIESIRPTATRLYLTDVLGGPMRLRSVSLDGKDERVVPTMPIASIAQLVGLDGDELLFESASFTTPVAWYRSSPALAQPQKTAMAKVSPVDYSQMEVTRGEARSKDGTMVPFTMLRKRGVVADGKNPLLLSGYGGYGNSSIPYFWSTATVWLEQGGIVVDANLRGGGEFGERWHREGMLTHKQNVFDDFIGVAQHLIAAKWTNRDKLVIEGGSNGGLLMGAVTTQAPQLFKAVVSAVGFYDMLRCELTPNGLFNTTEFGSVKNPDELKAMYAYSPYHHVVDRAQYPAMLLIAGDNDPRVSPYESRKLTARLQATATKAPVLLRTDSHSGHGMGTALDERIALMTDMYAFLLSQVGISYHRPTASR